MSVFLLNLNVLQAWNSCSGVFHIFEYCHLNLFCKAGQSLSKGARDSYHNLASPVNVKQNCLTLTSLGKLFASIQSLVLRRCDSTPSGLPENSVSFLPNFDKIPEGQAPPDQWGLDVLGSVVVEAVWVHFDQLGHCCLQDLELELQDIELDFGLQDLVLHPWIDLEH